MLIKPSKMWVHLVATFSLSENFLLCSMKSHFPTKEKILIRIKWVSCHLHQFRKHLLAFTLYIIRCKELDIYGWQNFLKTCISCTEDTWCSGKQDHGCWRGPLQHPPRANTKQERFNSLLYWLLVYNDAKIKVGLFELTQKTSLPGGLLTRSLAFLQICFRWGEHTEWKCQGKCLYHILLKGTIFCYIMTP